MHIIIRVRYNKFPSYNLFQLSPSDISHSTQSGPLIHSTFHYYYYVFPSPPSFSHPPLLVRSPVRFRSNRFVFTAQKIPFLLNIFIFIVRRVDFAAPLLTRVTQLVYLFSSLTDPFREFEISEPCKRSWRIGTRGGTRRRRRGYPIWCWIAWCRTSSTRRTATRCRRCAGGGTSSTRSRGSTWRLHFATPPRRTGSGVGSRTLSRWNWRGSRVRRCLTWFLRIGEDSLRRGLERSRSTSVAWSRFTFAAWLLPIPIFKFSLVLADLFSMRLSSILALDSPPMVFTISVAFAGNFFFTLRFRCFLLLSFFFRSYFVIVTGRIILINHGGVVWYLRVCVCRFLYHALLVVNIKKRKIAYLNLGY